MNEAERLRVKAKQRRRFPAGNPIKQCRLKDTPHAGHAWHAYADGGESYAGWDGWYTCRGWV